MDRFLFACAMEDPVLSLIHIFSTHRSETKLSERLELLELPELPEPLELPGLPEGA